MTPSLVNFFFSLLAGAAVVGLLLGALVVVSQRDKVKRN